MSAQRLCIQCTFANHLVHSYVLIVVGGSVQYMLCIDVVVYSTCCV